MVTDETQKFRRLLTDLMCGLEDQDPWQSKAVCGVPGALDDYETNPFDNTPTKDAKALADRFCDSCTVREQCGKWAKAEHYVGVAAGRLWGGRGRPNGRPLLEADLKKLKRKRNSA